MKFEPNYLNSLGLRAQNFKNIFYILWYPFRAHLMKSDENRFSEDYITFPYNVHMLHI